jgi:hypothetical protein
MPAHTRTNTHTHTRTHTRTHRLLLLAGADPWLQTLQLKHAAVHHASDHGSAACIRLLVHASLGVDISGSTSWRSAAGGVHRMVDLPTVMGYTPLMYAAWGDHVDAIMELGELGANPRARTQRLGCFDTIITDAEAGAAALHVAAAKNAHGAVVALMADHILCQGPERQASPSFVASHHRVDPRMLVTAAGRTPFEIARRRGHFRVLHMLNPLTALDVIFDREPPVTRVMGVPSLCQISAVVAQRVLLGQVRLWVWCHETRL